MNPPGWRNAAIAAIEWSLGRPLPDGAPDPVVLEALRTKKVDGPFYYARPSSDAHCVYSRAWEFQRLAIVALGAAFREAGLTPILFKGAEIIETHNGSRPVGLMADIDLIVERAALVDAMAVLYARGLRPGNIDAETGRFEPADIERIAMMEASHYQLPPFIAVQPVHVGGAELEWIKSHDSKPLKSFDGKAHFILEVDVHHRTAADIELEPFAERLGPSQFSDYLTLGVTDHLWTLLVRYYNEVGLHGKSSIRELLYCGLLIRSGLVDWPQLVSLARSYETEPACFYLLRLFQTLAPDLVPHETVGALRSGLGSRFRDFGWQLGKLFDFVEAIPFDVVTRKWAAEEAGPIQL